MSSSLYQGWLVPPNHLEAPAFRALMQLLVGVEQGHADVREYAASARRILTNTPALWITSPGGKAP